MKEMKIDFKMFGYETRNMANYVLDKLRDTARVNKRVFIKDFLDIYVNVMPCGEYYKKILSYDKTVSEFGWTYEQLSTPIAIHYHCRENIEHRNYYYIMFPTPTYFEPVVDKNEKENHLVETDIGTFGYVTEAAAKYVLNEMKTVIDFYGYVTLADVYDINNERIPHTECKDYGWTDLRSAEILKMSDNLYRIKVPPFKEINSDKESKEEMKEDPIDLERIAYCLSYDEYDLEDLPELIEDMKKEIEKELIYRDYDRSKVKKIVVINHEKISKKIEAMEKDIVYTAYKTILADSEED